MDIDNLIKMANQIGDFFGAWPDPQQGRDEIANHLTRFWDPRMRRQIVDYVQDAGGAGLTQIVIEAIRQLEPDARDPDTELHTHRRSGASATDNPDYGCS